MPLQDTKSQPQPTSPAPTAPPQPVYPAPTTGRLAPLPQPSDEPTPTPEPYHENWLAITLAAAWMPIAINVISVIAYYVLTTQGLIFLVGLSPLTILFILRLLSVVAAVRVLDRENMSHPILNVLGAGLFALGFGWLCAIVAKSAGLPVPGSAADSTQLIGTGVSIIGFVLGMYGLLRILNGPYAVHYRLRPVLAWLFICLPFVLSLACVTITRL